MLPGVPQPHRILEVPGGPWRRRALLIRDVKLIGQEQRADTYIWFLGSYDRDEWLAHALSEDADPDIADRILDGADPFEIDALIAYLGEPWNVIEALPVPHANAQRAIIEILTPDDLAGLRATPTATIRARRELDDPTPWLDTP